MRTVQEYAEEYGWKDRLYRGLDIQEKTMLWPAHEREVVAGYIQNIVKVGISPRMQTAAGYAYLDKGRITLHSGLLADPHMHEETFFHEVAHILAWRLARDKGHGWAWGYCQMAFGFKPVRCHDKAAHQMHAMSQAVSDDLLAQI